MRKLGRLAGHAAIATVCLIAGVLVAFALFGWLELNAGPIPPMTYWRRTGIAVYLVAGAILLLLAIFGPFLYAWIAVLTWIARKRERRVAQLLAR